MNTNNYCPVQASVNRYYAEMDDGELGDEIDGRKEELMKKLDAKDIDEAMGEVIEDEELLKTIARAFSDIHNGSRVSIMDANEIICGLYNAVECSIEQRAEREVKKEWEDRGKLDNGSRYIGYDRPERDDGIDYDDN